MLCLFAIAPAGCVYRFTNEHMSPPTGVHTIAIEAIYDTSREVLPHELLWESLQSAFASNGHLRLAPQSRADALVRAHIKEATEASIGSNEASDLNRDGSRKVSDPEPFNSATPPSPTDFRDITKAGEFRSRSQLGTVVEVEVWNLNTKVLLLKRSYPMIGQFQAVHAVNGPTAVTTPNNDFLRYDEARDARFKQMSDAIASSVVQDLLVH